MKRTHRLESPRTRTLARTAAAGLVAGSAGLLVAAFIGASAPAYAADARVDLGTATSFAVLASSTVTNTGPSIISGDLGLSPGSAVTGFPPGQVVNGTQHVADAVAVQAKKDLSTAYDDAAGRPTSADVTGVDLAGLTLLPGVYEASTSMGLSGTLVLNAQNNPDAVFIFKAGTTLTTGSGSAVEFINGGSPCNVFWQVGSSATLGTSTSFIGTLMASVSATLGTTATVEGRVLAMGGAVTLDNNLITAPDCSALPSGTGTPTGTSPVETNPVETNPVETNPVETNPVETNPVETNPVETNPADTPTPLSPDTGPTNPRTPVIPTGRPDTGMGGAAVAGSRPDGSLLLLGGLCGIGAAIAGALGSRRTDQRRR